MHKSFLAPESLPYLAASIVISIIFYIIWHWLLIVGIVLFLFFAYFFRNPRRAGPADNQIFFSPADGRIMSVSDVKNDPFIGSEATKITIFLSIFNVHINRAPMDGLAVNQEYRAGKFLPAFKPHASEINERNSISFSNEHCKFVVNQITGFVARRIVSDLQIGSTVTQRQRIGMIKFGSCTELIIPRNAIVHVVPGQKVKGGITALAQISIARNEHD